MVVSVLIGITWLTGNCHCPASGESSILHFASLGKDKNAKFEALCLRNVYFFHTIIKLKNL